MCYVSAQVMSSNKLHCMACTAPGATNSKTIRLHKTRHDQTPCREPQRCARFPPAAYNLGLSTAAIACKAVVTQHAHMLKTTQQHIKLPHVGIPWHEPADVNAHTSYAQQTGAKPQRAVARQCRPCCECTWASHQPMRMHQPIA